MRYTLLISLIVTSVLLNAQRYYEELFEVGVTSDVIYGENYEYLGGQNTLKELTMDIYEPLDDTLMERPVVIFLHAGSFLPKGYNFVPYGDKNDSCLIEMCTQFAQRGFVAISMNYRTGWNPIGGDQESKASTLIQAVYRSMHDAKTCVRFLNKGYIDNNTYGIDVSKVILAGDNSGAISAVAYSSLDKFEELVLPKFLFSSTGLPFVDTSVLGDIDGSGGDPAWNNYQYGGYSDDIHMVLNLGGSVGDSTWMEAGDVPIVSFHGLSDAVYETSIVTVGATGDPVVEVSGSHDLMRVATRLGNQDMILNSLMDFENDEFTQSSAVFCEIELAKSGLYPWAGSVLSNSFDPFAWYDPSDPNIDNDTPGSTGYGSSSNPFASPEKGRAYIDTIMGYFIPRALVVLELDETLMSVDNKKEEVLSSIFPNPTTGTFNLNVSGVGAAGYQVCISDLNGRIVFNKFYNQSNNEINMNQLTKGVYIVKIAMNDSVAYKKIVFR